MARLALRLCGHGRIGWLRAEGHGYDRDMTSVRRHATVGAGGLASYRLAHGVTADLAGAVLGRVERPRFYVADGEGSVLAVHRSGDVGLEVGLRLSMAFATL